MLVGAGLLFFSMFNYNYRMMIYGCLVAMISFLLMLARTNQNRRAIHLVV